MLLGFNRFVHLCVELGQLFVVAGHDGALGAEGVFVNLQGFQVILHLRDQVTQFRLVEMLVEIPYTKDYDAEEPPSRWSEIWDLSNWGLLFALDGEQRVGSAVVAWRTQGVNMLQGRDDLAVLWDIRVKPDFRGTSAGKALFAAAADWARERKCTEMKIETQNINVPACRFYAAIGAELWSINRFAYPDMPEETQLLWRYPLVLSV